MDSKKQRKIIAAKSAFHLWMIKNGLLQDEAAKALGLSKRLVQNYVSGESQRTGEPFYPGYAVRVLMRLIDDGCEISQPWPITLKVQQYETDGDSSRAAG